jgi:hypothetical protein
VEQTPQQVLAAVVVEIADIKLLEVPVIMQVVDLIVAVVVVVDIMQVVVEEQQADQQQQVAVVAVLPT